MTTSACSGCGVAIEQANVLYTTDARIVCAKCYAAEDILATDKRAAQNIVKAAVGCAVLGVVSFFSPLSGFMAVVIGCIVATFVSGIYAIQSLSRGNERFTRHLTGGARVLIWVCSILGFLLAGLMGLAVLGISQLMFL